MALLGLTALAAAAAETSWAARPAAGVRIGTYDSRAVGLAYGRSAGVLRSLNALHAEHKKAVDAGDKGLAKQLEKKGVSSQIRRHLQVFSNAPVGDALDAVRDQLPGVAQRTNVVAIVSQLDYQDGAVQPVDVTDELVALFDPTAETLEIIADCRTKKPLPIEEIAQMPANK